jgi:hypothetical protein
MRSTMGAGHPYSRRGSPALTTTARQHDHRAARTMPTRTPEPASTMSRIEYEYEYDTPLASSSMGTSPGSVAGAGVVAGGSASGAWGGITTPSSSSRGAVRSGPPTAPAGQQHWREQSPSMMMTPVGDVEMVELDSDSEQRGSGGGVGGEGRGYDGPPQKKDRMGLTAKASIACNFCRRECFGYIQTPSTRCAGAFFFFSVHPFNLDLDARVPFVFFCALKPRFFLLWYLCQNFILKKRVG